MGKSTISMAIFNSFLYVHQRVFFWRCSNMSLQKWENYQHLGGSNVLASRLQTPCGAKAPNCLNQSFVIVLWHLCDVEHDEMLVITKRYRNAFCLSPVPFFSKDLIKWMDESFWTFSANSRGFHPSIHPSIPPSIHPSVFATLFQTFWAFQMDGWNTCTSASFWAAKIRRVLVISGLCGDYPAHGAAKLPASWRLHTETSSATDNPLAPKVRCLCKWGLFQANVTNVKSKSH